MTPATEIQVVSPALRRRRRRPGTGGRARRGAPGHRPRASSSACARASTPRSGPWERADVRPRVAHQLAPVFESWTDPGTSFAAHRYLGRLRLPGRYFVDGVSLERAARTRAGSCSARLAVVRRAHRRPHSGVAPGRLRERRRRARGARGHAPRPALRGPGRAGPGLGGGAAARPPRRRGGRARAGHAGGDRPRPQREALVTRGRRARPDQLDAGSRAGRAEVLVPADPRRLDIRAEGPGPARGERGLGPGLVRRPSTTRARPSCA